MNFDTFNNDLIKSIYKDGNPVTESHDIRYIIEIKIQLNRLFEKFYAELMKEGKSTIESDRLHTAVKEFDMDARNYFDRFVDYEDSGDGIELLKLYNMSFTELASRYNELNPRE